MKAIVMAGGEGTRLRPLTEGRPKPMVELLGKSVLQRTVEHLKRYGFTDICFTLRYLPESVISEFGDGGELGVRIEHRVEREPLGTAGSVRACRDFIGEEDVLILSGDAVCDFDLGKIRSFHSEHGAEATLALYRHPEPTAFGLVLTDGEGRVTGFSEKPDWDRVLTDRVNTGIYVLSPGAVDLIPEGREYDFGRDLFPRMLREGRGLWAAAAEGYWCDMGSPEAYLRCCVDLIAGRADIDLGAPEIRPGVWSHIPLDGVRVTPPVYVGEGCRVEPGAVLGPETVLSRESRVERGARVMRSVLNGASVGINCRVTGAIVGRDARVESGAEVREGCVVGDRAYVAAGAVLLPGVRLWTGREAPAGRVLARSVTGDAPAGRPVFSDGRSLRGTLGTVMTPEAAMSLGWALGREARVGVAHAGGEGARLLADAVSCGVTASGGECCRMDCGFEAQLASSMDVFALDAGVFAREEGREMTLTVLGPHGLAPDAGKRRKIEAALAGTVTAVEKIGPVTTVTGAARACAYAVTEEVRALAGCAGRHICVSVTGTGAENRALKCALAGLGCEVRKAAPGVPAFSVLRGGFAMECWDERGRHIDPVHALALTAMCAMRLGVEELAVTERVPNAVERVASRYGCRLVREPRGELGRQKYLRDAVLGAAVIAAAMSRDAAELSRLLDDLPPFETSERRVEVGVSRARAMELLASSRAEFAADMAWGLRHADSRGILGVSPDFDGKTLILRAESQDSAAARELLDEYERVTRETLEGEE